MKASDDQIQTSTGLQEGICRESPEHPAFKRKCSRKAAGWVILKAHQIMPFLVIFSTAATLYFLLVRKQ
ncbi:MAG: hypothetical protein A2X27_09690 [Chloroflexi bacterium GWD2_49_16]|nr:MAG: hypothetical protein A2X27_09690 [Chloroflexi bacterium GWD2_49_16]HCC79739.1 hypothetical protein [Anaerolineae bacterium]